MLDAHLGVQVARLGTEGVVERGHVKHAGVKGQVATEHRIFGQAVRRIGGFDHQHLDRAGGLDPPHGAARQDEVVALDQRDVAEIAKKFALAFLHEQQLVAIGIAHQMVHVSAGFPIADLDRGIDQQLGGIPRRGRELDATTGIEEIGTRAVLVNRRPGRGWVAMVEVGRRAEEGITRQFALPQAVGNVGVGLARSDPLLHGRLEVPFVAHLNLLGVSGRRP